MYLCTQIFMFKKKPRSLRLKKENHLLARNLHYFHVLQSTAELFHTCILKICLNMGINRWFDVQETKINIASVYFLLRRDFVYIYQYFFEFNYQQLFINLFFPNKLELYKITGLKCFHIKTSSFIQMLTFIISYFTVKFCSNFIPPFCDYFTRNAQE